MKLQQHGIDDAATIRSCNPQGNSIFEPTHQTVANVLYTSLNLVNPLQMTISNTIKVCLVQRLPLNMVDQVKLMMVDKCSATVMYAMQAQTN